MDPTAAIVQIILTAINVCNAGTKEALIGRLEEILWTVEGLQRWLERGGTMPNHDAVIARILEYCGHGACNNCHCKTNVDH